MFNTGILFILVVILSFGKIQARCCLQKPINCYDCESSIDVRCRDPFNWSAMPEDHPPTMLCNGCCVKWVRDSKTSNEMIKRSCISQFQVNLFMEIRGCMQERSKTGHLCFCEEDLCNTTSYSFMNLPILIFVSIIIVYL